VIYYGALQLTKTLRNTFHFMRNQVGGARKGTQQDAPTRGDTGLTGSELTLIVRETAQLPAGICCRRNRKLALCAAIAAISNRDPSPIRIGEARTSDAQAGSEGGGDSEDRPP
jgi:hypothetical protein